MFGLSSCGFIANAYIYRQNKELEASEERKRKAKQLEMQRKEAARTGRAAAPRAPNYPVYTPPSRPSVPDTYDSYEAEKKKTFAKYVCQSMIWGIGTVFWYLTA